MALDDACTRPGEYTVDKRCYVTDWQKTQKPFNATVALVDEDDFIYCTGTIVKGYYGYNNNRATEQEKETIYVYTAKHCTDRDNDGKSDTYLEIQLQNGARYKIQFARSGRYNTIDDYNLKGDYALYTIINAPHNIPYAGISREWILGKVLPINAQVVGYGALKIMSDAEIKKFKNKYIAFMKSQSQTADETLYNGGVKTRERYGKKFVEKLMDTEPAYWSDLFDDSELKISKCQYFSDGHKHGCQTWGGNSGCGIFNNSGDLLGIHTRGFGAIGGQNHAGGDTFTTSDTFSSIPIAF